MDTDIIKHLAELMNEYSLGELEFEQADIKVRLVKTNAKSALPVTLEEETAPAVENRQLPNECEAEYIKSPLVGTFYRSNSPEAAYFVSEGTQVQPGTVVCIVEAMKVMNEIKAEKAGVITKVMVENGAPVEFGQLLFELKSKG